MKPTLLQNGATDTVALEELAQKNLAARLSSHPSYSVAEIERVATCSHRLFEPGIDVDEETSERIRALAALSQIELRPAAITSHRPIIGPVIVAMKRLTWPLIKVHLNKPFAALEEFCSGTVYALAKQITETEKLKQSLRERR